MKFLPTLPAIQATRLAAILVLAMLSACGVKQVTVKDTFPVPVLKQYSQHVGLYMDAAFRNYTHSEKLPGGSRWSIDLGVANAALYEQILAGMFTRVSEVASTKSSAVEAIIKPEIEEFQFATPAENQTDFYEAWFKYRIRFYDAQGKQLAAWPMTAYGRSESQFLDAKESLRDATQVAMRDAAAAMVLEFERHPAVRAFLYAAETPAGAKAEKGGANAS